MKIGLALGSGSSRGWSHIGVINELKDQGITPDIICGTSIGALVGASYVSNNMDDLEKWVCSLSKFETAKFFEINRYLNGFINKKRLHHFLNEHVASEDSLIEDLDKEFATIATNLQTGREVWLSKGSVLEAVWSSISLPGLFPAIKNDNQWLVDGGLVNPVPVSTCRAMGADIVIAVNLNGDIVGKHYQKEKENVIKDSGVVNKISNIISEYTSALFSNEKDENEPPNLFDAIAGSVNITQDRITRSRMAGDPPDILISPKLSHIGLLEFYRAEEAIEEGRKCVKKLDSEIQEILEMN